MAWVALGVAFCVTEGPVHTFMLTIACICYLQTILFVVQGALLNNFLDYEKVVCGG